MITSASRPNLALALATCASLWAAEPSSAQFVDIGAGLEDLSGVHAAWGDYDNDGDLDVLTTGVSESELPVSHLYRNDAGSFVDIGAGLPGMYEGSVAWGDYDNDGDLDILFAGLIEGFVRVSRVYRNDAGSFTDALAGLAGSSGAASWVDYDNDG
ncbi:MAG: VCBS repeat-containing protein, partial [Calditrichaeota bacterium]|nr:VCBS repeat-containing protein [Calditrichota bacterium]